MQTTSHILMIRPVKFGFNAETAVNNAFQVADTGDSAQAGAAAEFDGFVRVLKEKGVDVIVVNDTPHPYTPDSIFPNNWVSFHEDGSICLYPMYAANRRMERKQHVLQAIAAQFEIIHSVDLSPYENQGLFLEGTGSMVLDRDDRIAYACISPRTDKKVLDEFCRRMNYEPVLFKAVDGKGLPIYHSNVMMCVADKYCVICLDAVPDKTERESLITTITNSGKEIVTISSQQMNHFAGNMLQVNNDKDEKLLVMSTQAYQSLSQEQVRQLMSYNRIVHSSLDTIESNGGGSARCMMAEVHLPLLH